MDECEGQDDAEAEADGGEIEGRGVWRCRKSDAAVRDKDAGYRIQGLARSRHDLGNHRVPNEKLQQQRDVAHHLDIERSEFGQ